MRTKEDVLQALKGIKEPEWNKSMVELNLIRDIMLSDNNISLTVVTLKDLRTEAKENIQKEITTCIEQHFHQSVQNVHLRFRTMTSYERTEIETRMEKSSSQDYSAASLNNEATPLLKRTDVTFIAIASGKGGVGKSTVTVNLAVALARRGKKVGIIDADIYGFSIPDMMGIETKPKIMNNTILPVEHQGVKVISMGFFVEDNSPVIWRGPMLGKMLGQFFTDVAWGEIDYLLLDLPPGTGDIALDVHQMLPECKEIIVTTPHPTASYVAARAGSMAKQTNHEIMGIIENMSYLACHTCGTKDYVFGRGGGTALADQLQTKLLAQIPLGAPDNHPSEPDYSPSIYKADSTVGKLYLDIADQIIQ
ncbi:P-loop NTPase [Paenibacillus sp. SYP-B3998]|uniref:Iron-sulfur cluster carrier protein n=1 Tax=Paenibacillus sp. SYP-B3998 TaxID=2678564 RepID=A0A6G3ZWD2_9BACL|nr:Mrp/NBP35 family ATP-binding protein [Paenibacillus sp. SYP-B3998]NEW05881.1 P-loop NTPase [Paenibacillus sp. SYP-B3998]